jgi:cell division protein FtsI (penicillin-binding protein 3)
MTAGMRVGTRSPRRLAPSATVSRRRVLALLVFVVLCFSGLVARLVTLQVQPPDRLVEFGEQQRLRTIDLAASRGAIVDRNGSDLALSAPYKTIVADPQLMTDIPAAAEKLALALAVGTSDLEARLQKAKDDGRRFAYISRQVDDAVAQAALGLQIDGVYAIAEPKRIRPGGDKAALSVLGLTDIDNSGFSGLEKQYDSVLKGTNGTLVEEMGTKGRSIPGAEKSGDPAVPGSNLVLSLDRSLQFEVEKTLADAVERHGFESGVAIVSRVGSSEILANAVVTTTSNGTVTPTAENRAVTWSFEPGSIMKTITAAAIVDSGLASTNSMRDVPPNLKVYDTTFEDDTFHPTYPMSVEEIVRRSSNVGTILWAQDLGPATFFDYMTRFGLGATTGLGYPGESRGFIGDFRRWSGVALPSMSIGQSVTATPMQMLMALNAVANDGEYVAPRYVLGVQRPDGSFAPEPPSDRRRVISEASAQTVTGLLTRVVDGGADNGATGTKAAVAGYSVAGKTGTAWIAQADSVEKDGYRDAQGLRHLTSSFMGYLPAENPQLSIIVILHDTTDRTATGGRVAAPVFSEIANFAVRQLRIPPDGTVPVAAQRVRSTPENSTTTTTLAPVVPPSSVAAGDAKAATTTRAPTTTRAATTTRAPTTTRAATTTTRATATTQATATTRAAGASTGAAPATTRAATPTTSAAGTAPPTSSASG